MRRSFKLVPDDAGFAPAPPPRFVSDDASPSSPEKPPLPPMVDDVEAPAVAPLTRRGFLEKRGHVRKLVWTKYFFEVGDGALLWRDDEDGRIVKTVRLAGEAITCAPRPPARYSTARQSGLEIRQSFAEMFRNTPAPRCAQKKYISTFGYRTGARARTTARTCSI